MSEVERGQAALDAGEWDVAREAFMRAVEASSEDADAIDGLSQALWWTGDWVRARELRERAFALHKAASRPVEAARAAMWVANEHLIALGNRAAWNGWLERAAGMLKDEAPCVEHGWLVITRGRRAAEPSESARACTEAIEIARRH